MELFRRARGNAPEGRNGAHTNTYSSSTKTARRAPRSPAHLEQHRLSRHHGQQRRRHAARARARAHRSRDARRACSARKTACALCRSLRAASDVPLIILARRADEVDRIVGAGNGRGRLSRQARESRELLARMRNILRRANAGARRARDARAAVPLRRLAARHRGARARAIRTASRATPAQLRIPRARLAARAWQSRGVARQAHRARARPRRRPFDRSIDVRISRLRQVLGDDARVPRIIKTVHGEGYVIGVPVERALIARWNFSRASTRPELFARARPGGDMQHE